MKIRYLSVYKEMFVLTFIFFLYVCTLFFFYLICQIRGYNNGVQTLNTTTFKKQKSAY